MIEDNLPLQARGNLTDGNTINLHFPDMDMKQLVEELQAQNEELRQRQLSLKKAVDRYGKLYDFAPTCFIMVGGNNVIREANLTACSLLGVEKQTLIKTKLTKRIELKSRNKFYLHRRKVLRSGVGQSCELVMEKLDGGNFHAMLQSVPVKDKPEWLNVAITDISSRRRVEEELRLHHEKLEELVDQRTDQLRELARQLVQVQERERSTIARELHDEVGQLLTYAALLIDKARLKPDQSILAEARSVIENAVSRLRDLSASLSPHLLKDFGLFDSLESLFQEYARHTQIKVRFKNKARREGIQDNVALVIYRVVQEALTNIARHAQASKVNISISEHRGKLCVVVEDNGIGFDLDAIKRANGITGMRERALALGGEILVVSKPNKGTRVTARLPLISNCVST